nr:immunoglobulin heavy chain junction region [Mus musculus]
CARNDGFAYW